MEYSILLKSSFLSWPADPRLLQRNNNKLGHSLRWNTKNAFVSDFLRLERSTKRVLSLKNMVSVDGSVPAQICASKSTSIAATTPAACSASHAATVGTYEGIGINDFLPGKCYFITGSTGFLGKVLLEKMLRAVPDVRKIWVLIKAKNVEDAAERLNKEIIESELFGYLKQTHGSSYMTFMLSKLVPVVGDVGKSDMGMDDGIANEIAKEVDIIIHSAASTTFDERYETALNINTKGPSRLLSYAKRCKNLRLFVHISTAYVNGKTEGIVPEKPCRVGQMITSDEFTSDNHADSLRHLDIENELNLASVYKERLHKDPCATRKMRELGLERAETFGWPNTYSFTKAMGEMLLESNRDGIPVVIIRPTIVEGTYKEPLPGWIEGNRMMDPLILFYGKGIMPGFIGDPGTIVDVIPADMVVNAILAATTKHGIARKPGLNVYHVGSSLVNPLRWGEVFSFARKNFSALPFQKQDGSKICVPGFTLYSSVDSFISCFSEMIHERGQPNDHGFTASNQVETRRREDKSKRKMESILHVAKLYEPFVFYKARFDNSNTQGLLKEMSEEEKLQYGFDAGSINWEDYFVNIHIPGLRKHVLKGRIITS